MPEPVLLLANPAAGNGRALRRLAAVESLLAACGLEVEARISRAPGHLTELAAAAAQEGRNRLLVAGGDGSLSEVAHGVLGVPGAETALGLVPLGTGNDLIKTAGLPRDWRAACRRLAAGCVVRRIDAGQVNDRWFINAAGFGFDASIAYATERYKWLPGPLGYVAGLAHALRQGTGRPICLLRWDGGTDRRAVTLVAACNGQYLGGLFRLAPEAALDDGQMDLVWADALTRTQVLRHAPRVMRGTHTTLPEMHQARSRRLDVESDTPRPLQADGELLGREVTRVSLRLVPGALALWT